MKEREEELTILNEQLALERARQFGASSEQKLPVSDQPAAAIEPPQEPPVPEPAKKLRLATSGGGRKPLADHIPREDVRHQLKPEARVCKTCKGPLVELAPRTTESGMQFDYEHQVSGPLKSIAQPIRIDGERMALRRAHPLLGEHTVEVSREAGYTEDEIMQLLS